jgi:hypothetical protein
LQQQQLLASTNCESAASPRPRVRECFTNISLLKVAVTTLYHPSGHKGPSHPAVVDELGVMLSARCAGARLGRVARQENRLLGVAVGAAAAGNAPIYAANRVIATSAGDVNVGGSRWKVGNRAVEVAPFLVMVRPYNCFSRLSREPSITPGTARPTCSCPDAAKP